MISCGTFDAAQQLLLRVALVVHLHHAGMTVMSGANKLRRPSVLFGTGRVKTVETVPVVTATTQFRGTFEKLPVRLLAEEAGDWSTGQTVGAQKLVDIGWNGVLNDTRRVVHQFAFGAGM